eukprot:scaffold11574_cov124-Isochrysis_galbana.AAC.5
MRADTPPQPQQVAVSLLFSAQTCVLFPHIRCGSQGTAPGTLYGGNSGACQAVCLLSGTQPFGKRSTSGLAFG